MPGPAGGRAPSLDKDPRRIAGMFDAIAHRYDQLNHLLSAGLDRRWRRVAVDALELTDEALEQAIVGAVGSLESPLTPEGKGWRALLWHLSGVATEERQQHRDQVLATSRDG